MNKVSYRSDIDGLRALARGRFGLEVAELSYRKVYAALERMA